MQGRLPDGIPSAGNGALLQEECATRRLIIERCPLQRQVALVICLPAGKQYVEWLLSNIQFDYLRMEHSLDSVCKSHQCGKQTDSITLATSQSSAEAIFDSTEVTFGDKYL
jgi:hypothetical protein